MYGRGSILEQRKYHLEDMQFFLQSISYSHDRHENMEQFDLGAKVILKHFLIDFYGLLFSFTRSFCGLIVSDYFMDCFLDLNGFITVKFYSFFCTSLCKSLVNSSHSTWNDHSFYSAWVNHSFDLYLCFNCFSIAYLKWLFW